MDQKKIQNTRVVLRKALLLSFALLLSVSLFSQKNKNLVPNASFETHKNKSNVITNAIPWKNVGTVDYFLQPEKKDTSRFKGAHTGKCYAGLRFQSDYKEYMYVRLLEPLEKERTYHFKMYVRLLAESTVTVKQLGVYFSDQEFKIGMVFDQEGIVDSSYKNGISGTLNWILIQGDYLAHGGEKFVIIGNFKTKMKDDFVKKNKWDIFEMKEAYYYIDDISVKKKVTPADTVKFAIQTEKKVTAILPDSFVVGQIIEVDNIQFEKKGATFTKPTFKILDQLVTELNNFPFMEIEIVGYTNTEANETINKKISKERAKMVFGYLIDHGVINPLTFKGVGSSKLFLPKDSENNKVKSFKIELVIIKE